MKKLPFVDRNVIFVFLVPFVFLVSIDLIMGDYELFTLINLGINNFVLDVVCVYVSPVLFFTFYLFTLVTLYVTHRSSHLACGVISLATGLVSYGIGSLIKLLVQRPRPFNVLHSVRVIGPWETGSFSFPSTTTMLAFGFALPILFLYEKRHFGTVLSILSFFIGFSVIYAGFHFPSDVAAGIIFSFCIASCTSKMKGTITNFLGRKQT